MDRDTFAVIQAWRAAGCPSNLTPHPFRKPLLHATYEGEVVSKGRPQFNRNTGSAYTPEKTREFEARVARWVRREYTGPSVYFPVCVEIVVYEPLLKRFSKQMAAIAADGLVFAQRGDLDNKAKAILDGVQGFVFQDDNQIARLEVRRQYVKHKGGFCLTVSRCGLSENEAAQLAKFGDPA